MGISQYWGVRINPSSKSRYWNEKWWGGNW
jgi:hypothetical protein